MRCAANAPWHRRVPNNGPARKNYPPGGMANCFPSGAIQGRLQPLCSSVVSSTGKSEMIQVSLLLPAVLHGNKFAAGIRRNARKAAGHDAITSARPGNQKNPQRKSAGRPICRPRPDALENSTCSCATNKSGSNSIRFLSSSAPRPTCACNRSNAGLTVSLSRCSKTNFRAGFLSAPPRGDRGQFQFFTENVPAEAGQERHERGALHKPAARRIGHDDISGANRFDQSRARRAWNRCAIQADRKNYRPRGAG